MSQVPSLARTSKFEVWSATSSNGGKTASKPHSADQTVALSLKSVRRIAPSEVLDVAVNNFYVDLDGLEDADISVIHGSEDLFDVSKLSASGGGNSFYPLEICRAALFSRLVSLLHIASKLRPTVFETIVDLLNGGVVPALSVSGDAGKDTLGALFGLTGYHCYTSKGIQPAKAALASIRVRPMTLTNTEASFFETDTSLFTGAGSIIASAVANLTNTIDCVTAVSCEAVGSSADSFDPALWETSRPHRGQMNCAANLKVLLEGSRRSQQRKAMPAEAALAFTELPQSTGPARDYILAAIKYVPLYTT